MHAAMTTELTRNIQQNPNVVMLQNVLKNRNPHSNSREKRNQNKTSSHNCSSSSNTRMMSSNKSSSSSSSTSRRLAKNATRNLSSTSHSSLSIEDIADHITAGKTKSIIAMVGAGISTASGIPDFRSPGTGLYDNLQEYNIPYPEAVFDIEYFHFYPKPFFTLAKELYPTGKYRPNIVHYFLRLLHDKDLLLRLYTQNIDGLERLAGIPVDKLVEAHGTFHTSTCTRCRKPALSDHVKDAIFEDKIPRCLNENCRGVVKPDIVFFGEDLPASFYAFEEDFSKADLLLVLGTSLEVYPFAGIVDAVKNGVPRVLFNRERVGPFVRKKHRAHDVTVLGDISESLLRFSELLKWSDDLQNRLTISEKAFAGSTLTREKDNFAKDKSSQMCTSASSQSAEEDDTDTIVDQLKDTKLSDKAENTADADSSETTSAKKTEDSHNTS